MPFALKPFDTEGHENYAPDMTKQEIKERLSAAVRNAPKSADIKYVALFGTYVNGTPRGDSDIDAIVDLHPDAVVGLFKHIDIQQNLSNALGKKV